MAAPSAYPIRILINSNDVTGRVNFDTMSFEDTDRNVPSRLDFTVTDGAEYNIQKYNRVFLMASDGSETYFNGLVVNRTENRRGIQFDYDLECADNRYLLQKAIVQGTFTGTDDEILAAMFAAALPDLSSLFDLSGITGLLTSDMTLTIPNMTLLDAIEELAEQVGAEYRFNNGSTLVVNYYPNPSFETNRDHVLTTLTINNPSDLWDGTDPSDISYSDSDIVRTNAEANKGTYSLAGSWVLGALPPYTGLWYKFGRSEADGITGDIPIKLRYISGYKLRASFWAKSNGTGTLNGFTERLFFVYQNNDSTENNVWGNPQRLTINKRGVVNVANPTMTTSWQRYCFYDVFTDPDLEEGQEFYLEFYLSHSPDGPQTVYIDGMMIEYSPDVTSAVPSYYCDGDQTGFDWHGVAHASSSSGYVTQPAMEWTDSPTAAPYSADVQTANPIIWDLQIDEPNFDGINTVKVIGGYELIDVDNTYFGFSYQDHYDLEFTYYPETGNSIPTVYKNTGSDASPTWTAQTVGTQDSDDIASFDCLYDADNNWIQFATAPATLEQGFRVVGQRKKRIVVIVKDQDSIDTNNVQTVDIVYDERITSEDEAFARGQSELRRRNDIKSVNFKTMEPGLYPGMSITVADSDRSINDSFIIRTVRASWLGASGHAIFDVTAGQPEPALGTILQQQDRRDRPPLDAPPEAPVTLEQLYDSAGVDLFDSGGVALYEG